MYSIRSPAINISTKGIFPGVVEIAAPVKKSQVALVCPFCDEIIQKEDFDNEITEKCSICGDVFPPSEIYVNDYISKICYGCIEKKQHGNNEIINTYISLYDGVISRENSVTLLSLLMKKQ